MLWVAFWLSTDASEVPCVGGALCKSLPTLVHNTDGVNSTENSN